MEALRQEKIKSPGLKPGTNSAEITRLKPGASSAVNRCRTVRWGFYRLLICGLFLAAVSARAQSASASGTSTPAAAELPATLEREFFAVIRGGDAKKFLSYVPEQGINVGPRAQHVSRAEIEQQFAQHRDLYCKLFDSSCIQVKLDASARVCSYRELLMHSEKVRTAATEAVRGGVRQAILVAEVKNGQCAGLGLIDFIFNEAHGGWQLFSAP